MIVVGRSMNMRTRISAVLLTIALPLACLAQAGRPGAAPNKLALLVGIDKYKYPNIVSPLAGAVNDVEDMKALLIGKYEFPPENILVLKNEQATHAGIITAIQTHLIAKAQKDDIVVMHYSGHGSQMKDVTGKKISNMDETIVPFDSRDPQGKVFDISGTELHSLLRSLSAKTRNITFILDSCHSGTLVRGARARGVPDDARTPPPLPAIQAGERGLHEVDTEPVPPFALIAAATSKELAFEHIGGGREHGALTWFLTQQLRNAKPRSTWRDVMDVVISNVNANYPAQHPQLEGAQSDSQIFGGTVALARGYVRATPLDRAKVLLEMGEVSGVTTGSTFDIYPPGAKTFAPPEKPLALVKITTVRDFSSEAKLVSGGPVVQGARAVERTHRYGRSRLRLYLHRKESSPTLQALEQALTSLPQMQIVADASRCHLQLEESNGRVLILSADGRTTSSPVSVTSADAVEHLTRQMRSWAKWFNMLSIRPALGGPEIQVKVRAGQGGTSRDPFQNIGKADAVVSAGDRVTIDIANSSPRDVYITILDLSTDGSIAVIYPKVAGASEVLKAGLSLSQNFTPFVPPGRASVNDIIKVFASTKPIDLTPTTQAGIREVRGEDYVEDPLNDLIAEADGISRGLMPEGSIVTADATSAAPGDPKRVADWSTLQKTLRINRK
jgi:hypothetical protein